ncbi:hypothetical protein FRX31_005376, partial [Thalictrum thalictroides]
MANSVLSSSRRSQKNPQVIANFLGDFPVEDKSWDADIMVDLELEAGSLEYLVQTIKWWRIFTDGSVNEESAAVGIVIVTPDDTRIHVAKRLGFPITNNEVEYEAILTGLKMAHNLQIKNLTVFTNSLLVVEQYSGKYKTLSKRLTAYMEVLKKSISQFANVEIIHLYRGENRHVDALAYHTTVMGEAETQTIT